MNSTLEACFTAELRPVNAQCRAGELGGNVCFTSGLIAEQIIKLWQHLLAAMVGGEYLMNVKLHSGGSHKSKRGGLT